MRNKSSDILFEGILDDIGARSIDKSSVIGNSDNTQIDYASYEYEWRIYFYRDVMDEEFLTKRLPVVQEQLNMTLEQCQLMTDVSSVRFVSPIKTEHLTNNHYDIVDKYFDFAPNNQWPYLKLTAVFCCNMPKVKNIRKFFRFVSTLYSITDIDKSDVQTPIISIMRNDKNEVTFWPVQMSMAKDIVKNELIVTKQTNLNLSKYMGQFYLQLARLCDKTGLEIAEQLTSFFNIDWAPILFEQTKKNLIYRFNMSKSGEKKVKLDQRTLNFISTLEASTQMFDRMGKSLELSAFKFSEYSKPDALYITSSKWRSVKTLIEEANKHPLKVISWEMKTINANLDYYLMLYLGMFDCSQYMKTDEEKDKSDMKSEPVQMVLVTWGEIAVDAIETKFRGLFGNRYRQDVCDEITQALFKNANS